MVFRGLVSSCAICWVLESGMWLKWRLVWLLLAWHTSHCTAVMERGLNITRPHFKSSSPKSCGCGTHPKNTCCLNPEVSEEEGTGERVELGPCGMWGQTGQLPGLLLAGARSGSCWWAAHRAILFKDKCPLLRLVFTVGRFQGNYS